MPKFFVTGGSGFIGSKVVDELISHGHQVLALARSDDSAKKLTDAGAEVVRGTLEDLETLKKSAKESDGVLHLGFIHDFSNFEHSCNVDRAAFEVFVSALKGTEKPLIYTAGLLGLAGEKTAYETDRAATHENAFAKRLATENYALDVAKEGVRSIVIRLSPTTHGAGDHGFVSGLVNIFKSKGKAYYIGDGKNKWPAGHRKDAAVLYRLVAEKGVAGSAYHANAEYGVETKKIAEAIGAKYNLPVESISPEKAGEVIGFLALPFGMNASASSEKTQKELGYHPKELDLLTDIKENY